VTAMATHLFHLWDKSPTLIRETAVGYTLCNKKVPRAEMTRFPEDADCRACLARVAKENAPGDDRGAVHDLHTTPDRKKELR